VRRLVSVVLGLLAVFLTASAAQASTDVDDIIQALQESPVYVADGIEGTNSNTANVLMGQLSEDDNIVLVMLPSDEAATPEAIERIADQISDGLGGEYIVGVAVGDTYDADADSFPSGVADELMRKADSVSQNPIDTLGTFVRNVHDWVRSHPEAVAPSPETAGGSDITVLFITIPIALVLSVVVTFVVRAARRRVREEVQYNGPRQLRETIRNLMNISKRIKDNQMRDAIEEVCKYTEAYFSRLHPDKRYSSSAVTAFERHLNSVYSVVERYVDIRNNPEYYDEPQKLTTNAVASVEDFGEYVLKSIKSNNRRSMTDFTVDTKILSAQRFS